MKAIIQINEFPKLEGKENEKAIEIRERLYDEIPAYIESEVKNGSNIVATITEINSLFSGVKRTIGWRSAENKTLKDMLDFNI